MGSPNNLEKNGRCRRRVSGKSQVKTGLKVTVEILAGTYSAWQKCSADFIESIQIVVDGFRLRGNYRALP